MIGLVPAGDRLYYVAFVDHGELRRIISLRLAERREVKHYLTIKIPQLPRCARSRCSGQLTYEERAATGPWLSNVDSQETLC